MLAKRVDTNQKFIVEALESIGVQTTVLGLPLDLLSCKNGANVLLEVKTPKGAVKASQIEFISNWKGFVQIVTTWEEAERAVKDPRQFCLTATQKRTLAILHMEMSKANKKTISVRKLRKRIGA